MKTIYLDTNKWIDLSWAHCDVTDKNREVLTYLKNKVQKGEWRLPLSFIHCHEIIKMKDPLNRRRLWEFAVSLSRCCGLLNKQFILDSLIEESVHSVFNVPSNGTKITPFTKNGFFGFDFQSEYPSVMECIQTERGWIDFWLDLPDEKHDQLFEGLKKLESTFVNQRTALKNSSRNDDADIRKRSYIASLLLDYQEKYLLAIGNIGKTQHDIESLSMQDRIRLITNVPPLDVEVALAVQHQQQWDRREKENDFRDVSQLCLAVPSCDVVLTEKYWIDKLKREKMDKKYGTQLLSDISDLLKL
jgi:hypothetical protein